MLHQNFECRFYLIRHGESSGNKTPYNIGSPLDCSLSKRGESQAQAVGQFLKTKNIQWSKLYSSNLLRSLETAKIACKEMGISPRQIRKTASLVEQFQGDWNGKERKKVYTPKVMAKIGTKNSLFVPPNGESLRMVERRISNWLEDEILYNKAFIEENPCANIAIFSHGMAIRCLIRYIFQSDSSLTWKIKIFNCSVSCMVFKSDGWHPYSLNETAHLKEVGLLPY